MSYTQEKYRVVPVQEAYFTPSAARMGVVLPEPGEGHIEGTIFSLYVVIEEAARRLLEAKNPVIHPGPLVIWNWNEKAAKKAKAIKILADTLPARIIPMPDYRPKYPKINPEVEINPNHPNLTIWKNKEDVCVFVGVHCHMANLSLKIIRAETNCFTIALCAQAGHEDANLSLRDISPETILKLAEKIAALKAA